MKAPAAVLRASLAAVASPGLRATTFDSLGFPGRGTSYAPALEEIPQSVVCGFEWSMTSPDLWDLEHRLAMVRAEHRGFAYEGAVMGLTIQDAMSPGRSDRARRLFNGPGQPHLFLNYIGIGFAMARLPRVCWKNAIPAIEADPYHPTMAWLAVDGYGFDLAYFNHQKYVTQQERPAAYCWDDYPEYFLRACDQGVGRALWFIHGGDPDAVASEVQRFASERRGDLWAGVGLAATFAGAADPEAGRRLVEQAGPARAELSVGAVFAAKARVYAGHVPEHTAQLLDRIAGVSPATASRLADEAVVTRDREVPAYESWRRQIAAQLLEVDVA